MYLDQVEKIEKRKGFASAVSAGAIMAQVANSNGGKRKPKNESEDKPLEPHEMFSALEMVEFYLPGFMPDALRGKDHGSAPAQAADWLTPEAAEGLVKTFERGEIDNLLFAQIYARDWQSILARAAQFKPTK